MQSDASRTAVAAVKEARERYLSAVASAVEELRGYMSSHVSSGSARSERVAGELGPFAGGRVNPERFATFLSDGEPLDLEVVRVLGLATSVLEEAANLDEGSFLLELQPGADLYSEVGMGLARLGRAFGAARAVERARRGETGIRESMLVDSFPFRLWSRGERELAPPLVVELEGSDLAAAGLAAYMDGAQKIILVVRGAGPPAPLVRLVSPGVLVLQAEDPEELKRIGAFEGPAVGALMSPGQGARFVHDPALGSAPPGRLTVTALPEEDEVAALGSLTVWQQLQELRQLRALTEAARGAGGGVAAGAMGDASTDGRKGLGTPDAGKPDTVEPADQLAGWLLSQADLRDL